MRSSGFGDRWFDSVDGIVALPALLQRGHDTARKEDASVVASAINTHKSNNNSGFGSGSQ